MTSNFLQRIRLVKLIGKKQIVLELSWLLFPIGSYYTHSFQTSWYGGYFVRLQMAFQWNCEVNMNLYVNGLVNWCCFRKCHGCRWWDKTTLSVWQGRMHLFLVINNSSCSPSRIVILLPMLNLSSFIKLDFVDILFPQEYWLFE